MGDGMVVYTWEKSISKLFPDLSFAIQSFSFKEKAFAPVFAQLDHLAGLLRA
jgi:hypothetical protein